MMHLAAPLVNYPNAYQLNFIPSNYAPNIGVEDTKSTLHLIIEELYNGRILSFHPVIKRLMDQNDCSIAFEAFTNLPQIYKITTDYNLIIETLKENLSIIFDEVNKKIFPKHLSRSCLIIRDMPKKITLEDMITIFENINPKPLYIESAGETCWYVLFDDKKSASKCYLNLQAQDTIAFNMDMNVRVKVKDTPIPNQFLSSQHHRDPANTASNILPIESPNNIIISSSFFDKTNHNGNTSYTNTNFDQPNLMTTIGLEASKTEDKFKNKNVYNSEIFTNNQYSPRAISLIYDNCISGDSQQTLPELINITTPLNTLMPANKPFQKQHYNHLIKQPSSDSYIWTHHHSNIRHINNSGDTNNMSHTPSDKLFNTINPFLNYNSLKESSTTINGLYPQNVGISPFVPPLLQANHQPPCINTNINVMSSKTSSNKMMHFNYGMPQYLYQYPSAYNGVPNLNNSHINGFKYNHPSPNNFNHLYKNLGFKGTMSSLPLTYNTNYALNNNLAIGKSNSNIGSSYNRKKQALSDPFRYNNLQSMNYNNYTSKYVSPNTTLASINSYNCQSHDLFDATTRHSNKVTQIESDNSRVSDISDTSPINTTSLDNIPHNADSTISHSNNANIAESFSKPISLSSDIFELDKQIDLLSHTQSNILYINNNSQSQISEFQSPLSTVTSLLPNLTLNSLYLTDSQLLQTLPSISNNKLSRQKALPNMASHVIASMFNCETNDIYQENTSLHIENINIITTEMHGDLQVMESESKLSYAQALSRKKTIFKNDIEKNFQPDKLLDVEDKSCVEWTEETNLPIALTGEVADYGLNIKDADQCENIKDVDEGITNNDAILDIELGETIKNDLNWESSSYIPLKNTNSFTSIGSDSDNVNNSSEKTFKLKNHNSNITLRNSRRPPKSINYGANVHSNHKNNLEFKTSNNFNYYQKFTSLPFHPRNIAATKHRLSTSTDNKDPPTFININKNPIPYSQNGNIYLNKSHNLRPTQNNTPRCNGFNNDWSSSNSNHIDKSESLNKKSTVQNSSHCLKRMNGAHYKPHLHNPTSVNGTKSL
ncbi:unnamed protein product [Gordionus sp. m RMFG-2023]